MDYTLFRNTALAFLLAYSLIGFMAHITRDGTEDAYPFFSWSLFVQVPAREQEGFVAVVTAEQGIPLKDEVPLEKYRGFSMRGMHISQLSHELEQLGRAVENSNDAEVDRIRTAIEARLEKAVQYEVRRELFNPLEKFLTGAVSTSTTIAVFEKAL